MHVHVVAVDAAPLHSNNNIEKLFYGRDYGYYGKNRLFFVFFFYRILCDGFVFLVSPALFLIHTRTEFHKQRSNCNVSRSVKNSRKKNDKQIGDILLTFCFLCVSGRVCVSGRQMLIVIMLQTQN